MVMKLVRKLTKLDLMGALRVKYLGVSVGALLVMLLVAYKMDIGGLQSRYPQLANRIELLRKKGGNA